MQPNSTHLSDPGVTKHGHRGLIVHADDLGLTRAVNQGISRAHSEGIVTSASLMAVGAAFDDAVDSCRSLPSLDTGVHLTLVEERPLLAPREIPTLVDSSGRFHRNAALFTRLYFGGKIALDDVRRELKAQIARVLDAGIAVSHLDSHQHVHMLPRLFDLTVELALDHGFHAIRIPRERVTLASLSTTPSASRLAQQAVLNTFCARAARRTRQLICPDDFRGFLFGGQLNSSNLARTLSTLPPHGCTELMCHPSAPDPDHRYDHWGYNGPAELQALLDASLPQRLRELGVRLMSYRDLVDDYRRSASQAL